MPVEGAQEQAAATAPTGKVDHTYAWCLALLPLGVLAVAWLAPRVYAAGGGFWVWGVAIVASIALAYGDVGQLRRRGFQPPDARGAVWLIPAYLIQRARQTDTTPAIPVAWFLAAGLALLGVFTFAQVYAYSGDDVGSDVAHQLMQQQGSGPKISVDCPAIVGHAGDTFRCTATDSNGATGVITITLDKDARYTWQLTG